MHGRASRARKGWHSTRPVLIGTSGWQYTDWKGRFCPRPALAQWLGHYARHFRTVEVNNAFYRLPEAGTFARWRDSTPDDFARAAARFASPLRVQVGR